MRPGLVTPKIKRWGARYCMELRGVADDAPGLVKPK
jgi:hypothetical protein